MIPFENSMIAILPDVAQIDGAARRRGKRADEDRDDRDVADLYI